MTRCSRNSEIYWCSWNNEYTLCSRKSEIISCSWNNEIKSCSWNIGGRFNVRPKFYLHIENGWSIQTLSLLWRKMLTCSILCMENNSFDLCMYVSRNLTHSILWRMNIKIWGKFQNTFFVSRSRKYYISGMYDVNVGENWKFYFLLKNWMLRLRE